MLEYQKVLNSHKKADDPWKELANAIVEMTADDYRRNMTRLIKHGLSMSDMELVAVQSHITECRVFFESDWGDLLSHGLAAVIWEKLQAEFADDLAQIEASLPICRSIAAAGSKAERCCESVAEKQDRAKNGVNRR